MSSQKHRFTTFSKAAVDHLFAHAKSVFKDASMTILCAPKQHDLGRALFIISRKVGNAAKRNKLRRQLKAIFQQQKLYERGVDCAFITRKPILQKQFHELQAICVKALSNKKVS